MGITKETYMSTKKSGTGSISYSSYIPARWAKLRKDKMIGVVYYDLSDKKDKQLYAEARHKAYS